MYMQKSTKSLLTFPLTLKHKQCVIQNCGKTPVKNHFYIHCAFFCGFS